MRSEKAMLNNSNTRKDFDLEDRTLQFAKRVIRMCRELPRNIVNDKLVSQLLTRPSNTRHLTLDFSLSKEILL